MSTPLSNIEQVAEKMNELRSALQQSAPNYESLLHTIHVALSKDDELVHLLNEEQIGVLFAGLSKKKGVVIATATSKNKAANGKSLKNMTLDDL